MQVLPSNEPAAAADDERVPLVNVVNVDVFSYIDHFSGKGVTSVPKAEMISACQKVVEAELSFLVECVQPTACLRHQALETFILLESELTRDRWSMRRCCVDLLHALIDL